MEMRYFNYKGKERKVCLVEESDTHLKGFDLGYITEEDKFNEAVRLIESIEHDTTQKMDKKNFEQVAHLMPHFRNFKKSDIIWPGENA